MTHDISAMMRTLRASTPPEKRTARAMLVLLEATRKARLRTLEAVLSTDLGSGIEAAHKKQLVRALNGLGSRLDGYAEALAFANPQGPIPPAVVPLFFNVENAGHFTPDALTPFTIQNQLEAIEAFYRAQQGQFWRDYLDELAKVPARARKAMVHVTQGLTGLRLAPVLWGIGATVVGGIAVWAITRKLDGRVSA